MISLNDIAIQEQIYESANSVVYRGIREQDNAAVIIKVLQQDYPTPAELVRYKQEYEITSSLNIEGVVKAYSLREYRRTLLIIFEDFGGKSLQQLMTPSREKESLGLGLTPMHLAEFLRLAIKITSILGNIHAANVIHKDINPANIVLNPETGQIKIIDFGIATQLTRTNPTLSHYHVLEGTLAYMSPEQTGRMNRFLDYRTDFYSLGVTFYELLTGQLPFITTDVLELVHCHLAKQPVSPHVLSAGEVPKAISDIVMKMLAKMAEERYQSAWEILADLEKCLNQLETTGIEEFTIGYGDISDKFQISQKLYGREQEIATLLAAFDRVAGGSTEEEVIANHPIEMMLISGYSGVGKSALVAEIYKPITKQKGYFTSGKFDQMGRNIPYAAIVNALAGLVRQLLRESEAKLNQWRAKILSALGQQGRVIIDVIPEVELIVGQQPDLPELGPTEAQNRFNLVFQNFIRVFCAWEHPLVIFLDDLQWVDAATLKLIQLIMTDVKTEYLFLIGAYRDNEVNSNHRLMMTVEKLRKSGVIVNQISLTPLAIAHVSQLIADTLYSNIETVKPLAELVVRKTGGNPFFVNEFLKTIYAESLIKFNWDDSKWTWNLNQIEALDITDNVVDLMVSKLNKLPKSTQHILRFAACLGATFNLKNLSIISNLPVEQVNKKLIKTVSLGLIIPAADLDFQLLVKTYKFGHDRIQQAAYALIENNDKTAIHLQIGRLLLQNIWPERLAAEIFVIVDHLNLGIELVNERKELNQIAKLNLIAGKKAKAATAYDAAIKYLNAGRGILAQNSWETEYELTFNIYSQLVEVEYLNTNYKQAEILAEIVIQQAKTVLEKTKIYVNRILFSSAQNQMQTAIEIGLEALEMLGVSLSDSQPQHPIAELYNLPTMIDPYKQQAMRILMILFAPAYTTNPPLLVSISFTMVDLCINYGNSSLAAYAYSLYGLLLCGAMGDIELGYQFGQLALSVLEKYDAKEIKCKVENKFYSFIIHWKQSLRKSFEPLRETIQVGLDTGDIEFAAYASLNYCINLVLAGEPLEYVYQEHKRSRNLIQNLKQEMQLDIHQLWTHLVWQLHNADLTQAEPLPKLSKNHSISFLYTFYLGQTIISYFLKSSDRAVKNASLAEKYESGLVGLFPITQITFYSSLALLSRYPHASSSEQIEYLEKVAVNQNKLKNWAKHAPINFQHKYDLVEAETARILGQNWQAAELYERAIQGANQNGYLHEEALAYELAAEFYLMRGMDKIAQTYMTEARYRYVRWQATSKVKNLEQRYPQFFAQKSSAQTTTISIFNTNSSNVLDLTSVLKATHALSGEIELDNLLAKLMKIVIENAGAQTGHLILHNQYGWTIEASGTIESDQVQVLQSIPIGDDPIVSPAVVNYVIRTQKSLVLNDAANIGDFTTAPYIVKHKPKSILCTPLLNQGHLVGILYLENNLTTAAFTPERLEVLNLLSSQAAISIQNAKLYAELRESESKLTQFLEAVPVGISVFNPSGRISYINQTGQRILGQGAKSEAASEELASTYQVYMAGTNQLYPAEQMPAMLALKGENISIDDMELHRAEKIIPLSVQSTPIFDEKENITYSITAFIDITKRKQAEKILADYNQTLKQQVRDRTLELEREIEERKRAEAAASAASVAKSTFLANMSHELRSPLNAILGFSHLIGRDRHLSNEHQQSLGIIIRSGEHLLSLIDQVLDLSKIEAGRTTFNETNFDLYRVLNDVEDMFRLKAQNQQLQLVFDKTPDVPQYIRTDELKLRQVLINLVSNAIKFTEIGSVTLRVSAVSSQSMVNSFKQLTSDNRQLTIRFEVEDTGAGISPEELETLFEAFVQTKTGQESQQGTGLGLTISRKFVQLMGGEIAVSSDVGKGTVFKFDIKVSAIWESEIEPLLSTKRVLALAPNQQSYRILIADDNPENRKLLIEMLSPFGFELQQATNGIEAIEIWQQFSPHLIFMDMRMPVLDGIYATKQIKATEKGQATAIVAFTASSLEQEREHILAAGCDDFIRKPYRETDIFDVMHKLIGVRYVYDRATATTTTETTSDMLTSGFASLDADLVNQLRQAIIDLDVETIEIYIDQIKNDNEPLANALACLAKNFQFEQLLALTQP